MKYRRAFTIGKFLPPHQGHLMMIVHAASLAHDVIVAVEQQVNEEISVDQRCAWLQQVVPANVRVVPLYGRHPAAPAGNDHQQARFWRHWAEVVGQLAPGLDVIVTADDYGKRLAADQHAVWHPVDRSLFPISATLFKENPWERLPWLVAPAHHAFLRHLVVVGAESTGKTTLCADLSAQSSYPTSWVPEYAAHWIARHPDHCWDASALLEFDAGQQASMHSMMTRAVRWMVHDSHTLTTALWARHLGHEQLALELLQRAQSRRPDHVIVCSHHGTPWVPDVHRYQEPEPGVRQWFEDQFLHHLTQWGWSFDVVGGPMTDRLMQAQSIVEKHHHHWGAISWPQWCAEK